MRRQYGGSDVTTFDHSGVPGFDVLRSPVRAQRHQPAVVEKLAGAVKTAMADPSVKDVLAKDGSEIVAMPTADLRRSWRAAVTQPRARVRGEEHGPALYFSRPTTASVNAVVPNVPPRSRVRSVGKAMVSSSAFSIAAAARP